MHSTYKEAEDKEDEWIYSGEKIVHQTKKIALIVRIFIDSRGMCPEWLTKDTQERVCADNGKAVHT